MRKTDDISAFLRRWEYDSDRTVRKIRTAKGKEVLQVRLPLGIEQYAVNGRPDGKRPEGHESWLQAYQRKSRIFGREFVLDSKDCERLANEGILFYHRYLVFFQIGEYALCARDTARNLRLLDFVTRFAARRENAESIEQYRPYITRMHIMSRALHRLEMDKDIRSAIRRLEHGIRSIRDLPSLDGSSVFDVERDRSIKSLKDLIHQLQEQLPVSKKDLLKRAMEEAISREDYEKAASIRDQIRRLSRG